MNRHLQTVGLLITFSGFALAQPAFADQGRNVAPADSVAAVSTTKLPFAAQAQDQQPGTKSDTNHLSKKEKKELKKRRKEEEKERKKEAKKQEKESREQQRRAAKREAKEQKTELKKENKEVAKAQKQTDKRERKEEAKEIEKAEKQEAHNERASAASAQRYSIPVSYRAAPDVLRAQREVSRSIYSQLPNSHVIVLVNNANQLVLRGSAPSPSFKRRLLGLAMSAGGGYGIVDQLAANAMGSAASGLTSAAIGGVSDLIHGSGSRQNNTSSYNGPQGPPPDNNSGSYGPPPSYGRPPDSSSGKYGPPSDNASNSYGPPSGSNPNSYGPPPSNGSYGANSSAPDAGNNGLMQGSNACVNVSNSHQVLVTGQAASRLDGERLREFAQQIGGTNANIVDQLATRSNAAPSTGAENIPETLLDANALGSLLSPGSVVCVNTDTNDALLLTGTVGSSAELASVERSLQPLQGNARLVDQLTTGTLSASSRSAAIGAATATTNSSAPATVAESQVEQALHSIPQLSNIDVNVNASEVQLTGSVDTPGDERMAMEIAQQYAPERSVTDNLTVNRRQQAVQ